MVIAGGKKWVIVKPRSVSEERAAAELCPKPMKEATTEFPVSQEE